MDRILIVDDEFLIRYTLEEGLKDRGYDAYSAATVEEGLEFVRKYHPGMLLLDNLLENSVGMDEIVNFKNADEELQVIMMTAYGSVSQAVEATKRGAYDYILKPFDVDEIDMLIKRCLEQKRNRDSLVFLKGDVPQFLGVSEAAARIRAPYSGAWGKFVGQCTPARGDGNGQGSCGAANSCEQRPQG